MTLDGDAVYSTLLYRAELIVASLLRDRDGDRPLPPQVAEVIRSDAMGELSETQRQAVEASFRRLWNPVRFCASSVRWKFDSRMLAASLSRRLTCPAALSCLS